MDQTFCRCRRKIVTKTQTAYVLALHFDLLPEPFRAPAFAALIEDIQSREMHLSTGFVGTPYLNHVLPAFGRADIALCSAEADDVSIPGFIRSRRGRRRFGNGGMHGRMKRDSMTAGNELVQSLCVRSRGGLVVCRGRRDHVDPHQAGYKHIIIHPRPGGGIFIGAGETAIRLRAD